MKTNGIQIDLYSFHKYLAKQLNKFKEKHRVSINEVYKFQPKIMMNLLLNFESFDPQTAVKDTYMPEERVVNFNVGHIKINFLGKLRLTQDKDIKKRGTSSGPSATYGVIEDRDLYIKFDKPVIIKTLYMRPHKDGDKSIRHSDINIIGYKNENLEFSQKFHISYNNGEWTKVTLPGMVIDAIKLPSGFDIDDISVSHDSEFGDPSTHQDQLTNIIQTVIDELIEENTKGKRIKEEDI
jgi:hypothetical protein